MKCTVLGGGGFIGSHLSEALLALGHSVTILDRRQAHYLGMLEGYGAQIVEGDFLNEYDLREALTGADVVYHLISTTVPQTANNDPIFDIETNLVGTLRMLEEAYKAGVNKVVFTSSGGTVYGIPTQVPIPESHTTDPISAYGIGKLAIEKYLHFYHSQYGLKAVIFRIANAYGERQPLTKTQGVIPAFLFKLMNDEPLTIWGNGDTIRDYIHVQDIVSALVKVLSYDKVIRIFNIGSGKGYSVTEVVETIAEVVKKKPDVEYLPARLFDIPVNLLDISLAKTELNWYPKISLYDGIERMYKQI